MGLLKSSPPTRRLPCLNDKAVAARESVSGVNRDEEAANLLYYQQLYQANAKVISTAGQMFDTLMAMF